MDSDVLELGFLAASILSLLATGSLFTLKLADLVRVKRSGVNGPMLYMKKDNIRHQAFQLAISSGMLMVAVSSVNNPGVVTPQTKNLIVLATCISAVFVVDSVFTYRRRENLAKMIAQYEAIEHP